MTAEKRITWLCVITVSLANVGFWVGILVTHSNPLG